MVHQPGSPLTHSPSLEFLRKHQPSSHSWSPSTQPPWGFPKSLMNVNPAMVESGWLHRATHPLRLHGSEGSSGTEDKRPTVVTKDVPFALRNPTGLGMKTQNIYCKSQHHKFPLILFVFLIITAEELSKRLGEDRCGGTWVSSSCGGRQSALPDRRARFH